MAEEKKVLSCPFCGGRSHHILGARQIRMPDVVKCLDCFAEIQGTYEPESALIKWNTRAQLPSQVGEAVATDAFVPGSLADLLFQLGEKGIGVSGGTHGDHWRVAPLYTHPADQVEDGVVVSRELLVKLLDEGPRAATWAAQDKIRALLEVKP